VSNNGTWEEEEWAQTFAHAASIEERWILLRIYQAPSVNQKQKWFMLRQHAEKDSTRAKVERDEILRLKLTRRQPRRAPA
jgi:hypothetical protein